MLRTTYNDTSKFLPCTLGLKVTTAVTLPHSDKTVCLEYVDERTEKLKRQVDCLYRKLPQHRTRISAKIPRDALIRDRITLVEKELKTLKSAKMVIQKLDTSLKLSEEVALKLGKALDALRDDRLGEDIIHAKDFCDLRRFRFHLDKLDYKCLSVTLGMFSDNPGGVRSELASVRKLTASLAKDEDEARRLYKYSNTIMEAGRNAREREERASKQNRWNGRSSYIAYLNSIL